MINCKEEENRVVVVDNKGGEKNKDRLRGRSVKVDERKQREKVKKVRKKKLL